VVVVVFLEYESCKRIASGRRICPSRPSILPWLVNDGKVIERRKLQVINALGVLEFNHELTATMAPALTLRRGTLDK
jgi:hypothetical protein